MTANDLLMFAVFRYIIIATALTIVGMAVVDVLWWVE